VRQILQVAIQTAASRGFDLRSCWEEYMEGPAPPTPRTVAAALLRHHDWLKLLFSYPFARSLFGDDPEGSLPDWQYYLRELAALGLAYVLEGYLRRC
jgi:hypothetical protein